MANNSEVYKDLLFNGLTPGDFIRLTEDAFFLNVNNHSYENLISFLKSDNMALQCYALINLDRIESIKDAETIISCLDSDESRIREHASSLIKELSLSEIYGHFFKNEKFIDKITESLKDTNPRVCKNVTDFLQNTNNGLNSFEKLVIIIKQSNNTGKDIFTIYWCLFALESILVSYKGCIPENILDTLLKTADSEEYQIRERTAFIARILKTRLKSEKLSELIDKLSEDKNFYVRYALQGSY